MPHWLIKSGAQRALSLLPASHIWNEVLQKYVSRSAGYNADMFEEGLARGRCHYEHLVRLRPDCAERFCALELGTGWYPIVPICLYLCGATEVWCYDIRQYVSADRLDCLLQLVADYAQTGGLRRLLPAARNDRITTLLEIGRRTGLDACGKLGLVNIHLQVADARSTGLPAGAIDFFYSIGTLQHIPRDVLLGIFLEFHRLSRPHAVMSHFILLEDQYQRFDHRISPLNYLRYSPHAWRWLDSPITPQNRLRVSDYRELNEKAGFEVKCETNRRLPEAELDHVRLAPAFQRYAKDDLLVGWSEMVSQRQT